MSEDPTHLAIGDDRQIKQITGGDLQMYLMDPQKLNSYSYAGNNPIIKSDPSGKCFEDFCIAEILVGYGIANSSVDSYDAINTVVRYPDQSTFKEKVDSTAKLGADILSDGVANLFEGAARVAYNALTATIDVGKAAGTALSKILKKNSEKGSSQQAGPKIEGGQSSFNTTNSAQESSSKLQVTTYSWNGVSSQQGNSGGTVQLPGSPPRSANPIGVDSKSGAPIYCWGKCGN